MVKRQRGLKKVMYAVFFKSTGLVKAIKLEGQKTVTAKRLPEILQEVNVRGLIFLHDNASSHTAGLTVEFLNHLIAFQKSKIVMLFSLHAFYFAY